MSNNLASRLQPDQAFPAGMPPAEAGIPVICRTSCLFLVLWFLFL
jgi:hypothetical protein